MAKAYITQYGGTGVSNSQIAQGPAIATEVVTIGAEAKSTVFNLNAKIIRVHVDAICSIAIGGGTSPVPTATTNSKRMAADQTEYFGVNGGDQISVIANT